MLDTRIRPLNDAPDNNNGSAVVYVMSRDQRVADNFALLAAQHDALVRELPLVVLFKLYPTVENRVRQQYRFMLDGLAQVEERLDACNIPLVVTTVELTGALDELSPASLYFDFSPLRGPQALRRKIAGNVKYPAYEVDTHNVVPVWVASNKQEYAARTIRPKLHAHVDDYLIEPEQVVEHPHRSEKFAKIDWDQVWNHIVVRKPDGYDPPFEPGEDAARRILDDFIHARLAAYDEDRNDPVLDGQSGLSPYLHFGQVSSLRAALNVTSFAADHKNDEQIQASADAFIEQIIVRKELSDNFCYYNANYDNWDGLPEWAGATLDEHRGDAREHLYDLNAFESASTHDDAWNAAQTEMMTTGKMHNYMRMYWAKKILEWTPDPETAIDIAITLNDRYELDGYDPNGYVNILWAIGGLHDRAWQEREVYGKIRYMNFNGLKRKFDIEKYIERWSD